MQILFIADGAHQGFELAMPHNLRAPYACTHTMPPATCLVANRCASVAEHLR